MRLFEIVAPKFYLTTAKKQTVGEIIERLVPIYPLGATLEGKLECRRQPECLPREKSLYLCSEPLGAGAYTYLVEPIGRVDRHHVGWLKMLSNTPPDQCGEIDQYATAYWSGKEHAEGRDEPWEYRALQAKILSCLLQINQVDY